MNIYKIDSSALNAAFQNSNNNNSVLIDDSASDIIPEVGFDAGPEFNLNFFDNPEEDSNTQGGYSDCGSVESAIGSPPPPSAQISSSSSSSTSSIPSVHQYNCNELERIGSFQIYQSSGLIENIKCEQFNGTDSITNASSKSLVSCKVCGDKASGYHYGVTSCEGCKGFFRRSIQKQIEYRCLRDGKCLVIRLNRNRCQFCRFKKCLSVGMSRDSVRYGRVPKRSRELSGSEETTNVHVTTPGSTPSTPATPTTPQMCSIASPTDITPLAPDPSDLPGSTELTVYDVILCVSQAHRAHCTYTDDLTRQLLRKPIVLATDHIKQEDECELAASVTERKKILLWQHFAGRITPGVQRVVEFAKRVPGFCDFSQDDQLILIKLGFFEVWLSHVTKLVTDSTLTFDDGSYLSREQLELLYDTEFVTAFLNFSNGLNSYGLIDTELGLFSALILLAANRPGITEHKQVSRTRERIAEALRVQIVRSRPGSVTSLQLMPALEAKILELRALGARHCTHLSWLRTNWTLLRLPPLFAEIFDIPKCEDDE